MLIESPYLRAEEAAAHLRISPRTLRKWAAEGRIPKSKLSRGLVLFRRKDLDAIAEASFENTDLK